MFKSLKIGWAANDIGERIERVTGYVVDILIYYRLDIKTHDTIFIFSQNKGIICSLYFIKIFPCALVVWKN